MIQVNLLTFYVETEKTVINLQGKNVSNGGWVWGKINKGNQNKLKKILKLK